MLDDFNLSTTFFNDSFFRHVNHESHHSRSLERRKTPKQLGLDRIAHFSPKNNNIGKQFITWEKDNDKLPTISSRNDCFREFANNVSQLRNHGLGTDHKIRFIDKVDYSLNVSAVRSLKSQDAINLYKRQMGFISMYSNEPNPFQTIRDLFNNVSVYNRPNNYGYTPSGSFAGTYVNFLLDYYFSLYIPNETEWNIYLMQQRMALNEIEKDVFAMLNGHTMMNSIDENGELQITAFSTVGLELIADILRPVRIDSPQIESFEAAFTTEIWRSYFPYTWALVNPSEASKVMKR
ncbi:hypothetical protein YK48G_13630 [Lentilactobacillus fungorum]|uniref:Uncharacterized protein n=1 Tax=Lentilactobacillus fungorum TaxID=2201250 RepID=A0ABQ3VYH0_9LACO|nr:hypothetical protein [Lentilactobacillus fungorum]GHP13938.1 hypothetical protein YK48G_13630 [Lentilactobacillus fungorum]